MSAYKIHQSISDFQLTWQQSTRVAKRLKSAGYERASVRWVFERNTIGNIVDVLEPDDETRCKTLVDMLTKAAGIRPEVLAIAS